VRWQLAWPGKPIGFMGKLMPEGMPNGQMLPEFYNSLFTMHATIMIFFAIMPILIGAFGNFVVPLQIGARDMAFPRLNLASFWVAVPAAVIIIWSFFVTGGAAQSGWTSYAPLSAIQPRGQTLWLLSLLVLGISSLLTAVNIITTTINMRAPGMTFFRLPLTVWALFITAILLLLALPVLSGAMIMLLFDRVLGTTFFLPAGLVVSGNALSNAGGGTAAHERGRGAGAPVAAPLLVLRAPRGLHHDPAGDGDHLGDPPRLREEADLRVSRNGLLDHGNRGTGLDRVGTPHVPERYEPDPRHDLHDLDHGHRGALGHQSFQLAGDGLGRQHHIHDPDVDGSLLRLDVRHRRPLGDLHGLDTRGRLHS
jgi:hypothetical protein